MKIFLKIFIGFIFLIILFAICGFWYLNQNLKKGENLEINPINLGNVEDGVYEGTYVFGRWTNTVEITVENHKIIAIKVIRDVLFVKEGVSNEVFEKVIINQNTDIEMVSGATVTTKAYLKAIENGFKE